jgi:autotransporter-associated beta strand protein
MLGLTLTGSATGSCWAIDSTWQLTTSGLDWDAAPWSNGVPDHPGDHATLIGPGRFAATINVSRPITLGELTHRNAISGINGSGSLWFDNPGADPAKLTVEGGSTGTLSTTIGVPIGVVAGEELALEIRNGVTLNLTGGIAAGSSPIDITGGGQLRLTADSSAWTGALEISGGALSIEHTKALAGAQSITARNGAFVTVLSQDSTPETSRDDYVLSEIVLENSLLQTNVGAGNESTVIDGDVVLSGSNIIRTSSRDGLYLMGGIGGDGGVNFQNRNPVSNLDPYNSAYIYVAGPVTHTGSTTVGPKVFVSMQDASGLGSLLGGTLIDRGTLSLGNGGGSDSIVVNRGRLDLQGAATPYGHSVELRTSRLTGGDRDAPATLTPEVQYTGGVFLGPIAEANNLILDGKVTGAGSTVIQDLVSLQGGLEVHGNLYIDFRGAATLAGSTRLDGEVFLVATGLTLGEGVGDLGQRVRIAPAAETADARLRVSSDLTIESLIVDPRGARRDSTDDRTSVSVDDGATLRVVNGIDFRGGLLRGAILGESVLVKKDLTPAWLDDIAGSDFEEVHIEGGQVRIRGDAGLGAPIVRLSPHRTASVELSGSTPYDGDIYLNNAPGDIDSRLGALSITNGQTLEGDLYLGDRGSTVSGGGSDYPSTSAGVLSPNSKVHGGDLAVIGRTSLIIRGGEHTYSGVTRVMNSGLVLADGGRLNSTSGIIGTGRLTNTGGRGTLVLDNSLGSVHQDRIPDTTPIDLNGLLLQLVGKGGESITERLGTVRADGGVSDLAVTNPTGAGSATTLAIQRLDRQAGGVVRFVGTGPGARVILEDAPVLDDGLLGGWAVAGQDDFASYGPEGVVPYSQVGAYKSSLNGALATDNVMATSPTTLLSDVNVNALRVRELAIDLGGHALTIESGGLMASRGSFSTISNGVVRAGVDAGAELLTYGNLRLSANITDNAAGAVGLTHSSSSDLGSTLVLSGVNTYSGPTIINSGLGVAVIEAASVTAIPTGSDLILNGGRFSPIVATTFELRRLEIRSGGLIQTTSSGVKAALRPEEVLIDSGSVTVALAGNAPLTKIGPSSASFSNQSLVGHTGPITVESGTLSIDRIGASTLDDTHAVTVRRDGVLQVDNELLSRKLVVDGGSFEGTVGTIVEVTPAGGYFRGRMTATGSLTGEGSIVVESAPGSSATSFAGNIDAFKGDLTFRGRTISFTGANPAYAGNVRIEAAKLAVTSSNPFGSGLVEIASEGKLQVLRNLTANTRLSGGIIEFVKSTGEPSAVLTGGLRVSDHSYVYISPSTDVQPNLPTIQGPLTFEDGSNLAVTVTPGVIEILESNLVQKLVLRGDLEIEGAATLTSFDSLVTVEGVISSQVAGASLNLVGNNTFNVNASVEVATGASLALLTDGVPSQLSIRASRSLSGSGALVSNITVEHGGVIAPGNSAGILTVDGDVNFGAGAIYEWEVEEGLGSASWDQIVVEGVLSFQGSWFLDIAPSTWLTNESLLIASADQIVGFDPMNVMIRDAVGNPASEDYTLVLEGSNLFLISIPEPQSLTLAIAWSIATIGLRDRRGCGWARP